MIKDQLKKAAPQFVKQVYCSCTIGYANHINFELLHVLHLYVNRDGLCISTK